MSSLDPLLRLQRQAGSQAIVALLTARRARLAAKATRVDPESVDIAETVGHLEVNPDHRIAAEQITANHSSSVSNVEIETDSKPVESNAGDSARESNAAPRAGDAPASGAAAPTRPLSTRFEPGSVGRGARAGHPAVAAPVGPPKSADSAESFVAAFTAASATEVARMLPGLGDELGRRFSSDRSLTAESAPAIQVSLAGTTAGPATTAKPESAAIPPAKSVANVADLPPVEQVPRPPAVESEVLPQPAGEALSTQAGTVPTFVPVGEADPNRVSAVHANSSAAARQLHQSTLASIAANRAGEQLVPVGVERCEAIAIDESTASLSTMATDEMGDYLDTAVPDGVRGIADADFAPILSRSLAGPQAAVDGAARVRDERISAAYESAQAEAAQATESAQAEQSQLIADGHAEVEAERAQGLEEGRAQLQSFNTEIEAQHGKAQAEIRGRIAADQQRANDEVAKGEAEARQHEADAQKQADEARSEADSKKEKRNKKNWWGRIVDTIVEIPQHVLNWLSNRLTEIFAAAKELVRKTLEAAKSVAKGIINGLKTAVVGMIQAFAVVVKGLVGGLLVFFPKLRERVNAAIDSVVEATVAVVNKVADGLNKTVDMLVDKVQSVVNRVIDTFELVVVTQIAIAQALLSGNFLEAAKILFLAACKSVGIPGEQFLGILSDAGDALLDIMKRPAAFLGYLVKAVSGGLQQFLSNFPQRLMSGLTGWLFGALAVGGIVLPKVLDLKSIFMLIVQVMGFTYDFIRARVVRLVGERAVGVIEQVMTPIRIMFTDGPGALWEWIKDQAEEVKNKIVEAASQWLVTQVITQAAVKLASMFTPVGAFVQAVLMMYNTIMFFVSKIQEIFVWVKSITSSLATIAKGTIGAAVEYIDQAMSKSIPLIIDFLAKLVGISGLGEQIRNVVSKLRAPVEKTIDFVIGNVVGGAKAVWGGVKAGAKTVAEWWKARESFTSRDGEHHELYFTGSGENAQLTIASSPQQFEKYIHALELTGKVESSVLADLRFRFHEIEGLRSQPVPAPTMQAKDHKARILLKLSELAVILSNMPRVAEHFTAEELIDRCAVGLGMEPSEFADFKTEEGITDTDLLSFAADMTPVVGTLKGGGEVLFGIDPVTGKEVSRWWGLVGLIPWGKVAKPAIKAVGNVFRKATRWIPKLLRRRGGSVARPRPATSVLESLPPADKPLALPPGISWDNRDFRYKKPKKGMRLDGSTVEGSNMSVLQHIFYRHGPKSGFPSKKEAGKFAEKPTGKFAEGTTARIVKRLVDEAVQKGRYTFKPGGGGSVIYDFHPDVIGKHTDGSNVTRLEVLFNKELKIKTAYPTK